MPADSPLHSAHVEAMFRKAIGLCEDKGLGLRARFDPGDWVVVHVGLDARPGASFQPGAMTDPRLLRSLVSYLAENRLGRRITVAAVVGAGAEEIWRSDWGGSFDGLSYRSLVQDLARRYPNCHFELLDLAQDHSADTEIPGGGIASRNPRHRLHVATTILQCDRLITMSPLRTCPRLGVSLSMGNYMGIASRAAYGANLATLLRLGTPHQILVDLYSYHPADFALAGGTWGLEGPADQANPTALPTAVRHNILVAGRNPLAVDAVAASVMGFDPEALEFLKLAGMEGFGIFDTGSVWVRGKEIEQVRRPYKKSRS